MIKKQKNILFKPFLTSGILLGLCFLLVFLFLPLKSSAAEASPVYRFYSAKNTSYFLTISESEKNGIIKKYTTEQWAYEGEKFTAYSEKGEGLFPVYRFWSPLNKSHFFTSSETEKNKIIAKYTSEQWRYGGVGFYAYKNSAEGNVPVFRLYSKTDKTHIFTTSEGERECLLNSGWRNGGIGWYAPETGADLSTDSDSCRTSLGPQISVGLWSHTRSYLKDNSFRIDANKDYVIKDKDGKKIAKVQGEKTTKVKYAGDGKLRVYDSIDEVELSREVRFEAADGNNQNIIFDAHRPGSSYDEYRGKFRVRYSETSKNIWIINILPLEQYAWGNGELAGTGDMNHNRVMATIYRTYGYWKIKYSTKYASEGFKVTGGSGCQIYRGYDWEKDHPRIKSAVRETFGRIIKYGSDVALSPYSSWTDGRTRSFEERWGSKNYPWCKSVKDPYGKHPSMTTKQLENAGNHMVGVSAHGSLNLATNHGWAWHKIIKYYLNNVSINKIY